MGSIKVFMNRIEYFIKKVGCWFKVLCLIGDKNLDKRNIMSFKNENEFGHNCREFKEIIKSIIRQQIQSNESEFNNGANLTITVIITEETFPGYTKNE